MYQEMAQSNLFTTRFIDERIKEAPASMENTAFLDPVLRGWATALQTAMREGLACFMRTEFPDLYQQLRPLEPRTKRQEQRLRKRLMETARQEHFEKTGIRLPNNRIFGKYARGELMINDRWADSREVDESTRCEECQQAGLRCIVVVPDECWNKSHCVSCVERKIACSMDIK